MRHLIVLTGLLLSAHVHADTHKPQAHKPIDYSRNHALSGASASPGATQSALDNLLASRGLLNSGKSASRPQAAAEPSGDDFDTWLMAQSPAQESSGTSIAAETSSRLADRFATLVVDAISHIGIPYKFGGNGLESGGFDCSGFVKAVYLEALGTTLPRRSAEQAAATETIAKSELRPGDLVFFNTMRRSYSHVGIYVGDDKFVHAPRTGARIRIDSLSNNYWTQRFNGARRVQVAQDSGTAAAPRSLVGTY